jgi:hypothetical protein
MKLLQRWKMTALHNKALVMTSVIVAFGTIFYALVAVFQYWLMVEGGRHTDEQIGRVISNVNWMARAMDQSAQSAQSAINATQDQMRLDQRAWVGLAGVDGALEVGHPFIINTHYFNTGRTPAMHVIVQARGIIVPRGTKFSPDYSTQRDPILPVKAVTALFPNQVYTQHVRMSRDKTDPSRDVPAVQADSDALDQGNGTIYVFGRVCYQDVFREPHWMRFCNLYNPKDKSYYGCNVYNEIDTGKNGTEETCKISK